MEELMNLDNLSESEKKQILLVIKRDEELKKAQDTRLGQLKSELHNLRMQSVLREGDDLSKICARCHKPFGFFFNTGDVCSQCKFRVCTSCRESLLSGKWLCVLCYKQIQLKGISGDWIYGSTDNENHRKSFSGAELVKKSLRKSLSANGNLTSKSREADGSDGGPDSKRGLAKNNSASQEELDRVGYPKDSDKKRLSSLFDSFKSSKDETEEQIEVRHVSCRRRRDSDSETDSGSSLEGESPMEVGDSKTQSSDRLSSAYSPSLAQNLSETESTSDMLREKRLSAEISVDAQVPSEVKDQNGGQSSEETSRRSPEAVPVTPTETVITVKRRSGEPEYLPTLDESVECPVSPVRNTSQVSEHRPNIVRRTSSEKSDSSMSSARTASPATKMRLLDLASKRALERESFDQEESGNESPKHKEDSLTNGLSQGKRTPINGPSARHEMGEGFGVFKAVEESSHTLGGGRHVSLEADPLGPSSNPPAPQSMHAHESAFHSVDTEPREITPNETLYTERGNLSFGDDNMLAFSDTDKNNKSPQTILHDTSPHELNTQTNTGEGDLFQFHSDVEHYGDGSVDNLLVENQFVSSDSLDDDHGGQSRPVVTVTTTVVTTAAAVAAAGVNVSQNLVPCSQVPTIPTVTQFQSSPVVSSSNSEVNVAFSSPEPSCTQIAFNISPPEDKTFKSSKESFIESLGNHEQRSTNTIHDVSNRHTQDSDIGTVFSSLTFPKEESSKDETEKSLPQTTEPGSMTPHPQVIETEIGSVKQADLVNPLSQASNTRSVKPLSESSEHRSDEPTESLRPLSQYSRSDLVGSKSQNTEDGSVNSQILRTRSVQPLFQTCETGSLRQTESVRPLLQSSENGSVSEIRSVRPLSQGSQTGSVRPLSQSSGNGSVSEMRSVRPLSQGSQTGSVRPLSQSSGTGSFSSGYDVDIGVSELVLNDVNPRLAMMFRREQLLSCSQSSLEDECSPGQEKDDESAAIVDTDSFGDDSPMINPSDNDCSHVQEVVDRENIEPITSVASDPFDDESPLVDLSLQESHIQKVVADVHQSSGSFDYLEYRDSDLLWCQNVKEAVCEENVQLIDLTDSSKVHNFPDESVGFEDIMMTEGFGSQSQRNTRPSGTVSEPDEISTISKSSEEVRKPSGGVPEYKPIVLDVGIETHQTLSLLQPMVTESSKEDLSSPFQNVDFETSETKDAVLVNVESEDHGKPSIRRKTGNNKIQGLLAFWMEKQAPVSDVERSKQSKEHDAVYMGQSCSTVYEAPVVSEAETSVQGDEGSSELEVTAVDDDTGVTVKDDTFTNNEHQVIAKDAIQIMTKDNCFSTSSTCTATSRALPETVCHLTTVSDNLSDSDITISDLTNSSKFSDASDPSVSSLSSDTESSVLAVDPNPQYACSSSDFITSAREIEIDQSSNIMHVIPDNLTSASKLEVDVNPERNSMLVTPDNLTSARQLELDMIQSRSIVTSDLTREKLGVGPVGKEDGRVAVEPSEHIPTEPASASANSPQPEMCSESEAEDIEVAEYPLYASPEEVQDLQSSADEAVDTLLEVKLQDIRELPVQAPEKMADKDVENKDRVNMDQTQENIAFSREDTSFQAQEKVVQLKEDATGNYINDRVHMKNDNEKSANVHETFTTPILRKERGRKRSRHEESAFENEDILETKSEPSNVYQNQMDDQPERTSTPKNRIETIDDDTLFKLLSSVPLSANTSGGLESPKRRGSKDDSEIQLKSTSLSSTTAASSAATMANLSTVGVPVNNDEGDPFATESADVREAMQRYLEQEEEMSDCLSVITERTEPEEDDDDDVSDISKGLDETVEDEDLDKEIEKIYQANLHIDSYLSGESFSSGSVSSAIKKSRKGLQKKHIEEVLSSPISHDLPVISESVAESTASQDRVKTEDQEGEMHDKLSTVSDTISAYLSDMSSVDNSNLQTPASSEPVSDEDEKSDQAATASDEQDSAWFDMSMSVDSVKEVLTPRGSVQQREELKTSLSSETLCDEELPQDDENEVDENTNTPKSQEKNYDIGNNGTIADSQVELEISRNQISKSQSDNQNDQNELSFESGNASTSLPVHVAVDEPSNSDTILSSSLITSPPDLDLQAQTATLTSTFAASPTSPTEGSPDIRPQVKVTGDVMSDETGSHGGDSGHISGNSAENTPEHRSRSPRHSHLSIPSLALTSTSAEEASQEEEDEDIDEMVATHKSVGSLRGSYGNLSSNLADSRESLYSVYSDAGEINYGKIPVTGEILFGVDYNYKTGALEIYIKQCRDVAPVDTKRNKSDPYVKTYLLPDRTRSGKRKTKIKKHTLNPTFDEVLRYVISKSEVENRALWVTVWHHDRFGRNDFLGEVMIGLDCYKFGDSTPIWYPLQERLEAPGSAPVSYKGDLVLSVKYVPAENIESKDTSKKGKSKKVKGTSRGEVQVLIKEARNLTAVRSNGASDPFCKAYLLPEKHKSCKQKTPVIKRNCNPTWNHVFLFEDIDVAELKDRSLELTVWDYDKITSNDFLGGIRLNLGTGVAGGRNAEWMDGRGEEIAIWQSMMDRPNCWNDATIGLRASMGKSEIRK